MSDGASPRSSAAAGGSGTDHAERSVSPVETMLAADQASRALGITLVSYGPGVAEATMVVTDAMVNGHDIAHGGMIFSLADTAFACACNSFGPITVASSAEIVFVATARRGDVLTAQAQLHTAFGRSGIYDVTVRRGEEVIAEFRGRSHRLRIAG